MCVDKLQVKRELVFDIKILSAINNYLFGLFQHHDHNVTGFLFPQYLRFLGTLLRRMKR